MTSKNISHLPVTQDVEWRKHEDHYRSKLSAAGLDRSVVDSIVANMKTFHYEVFSGAPPIDIHISEELGLTKLQYDELRRSVVEAFGRYRQQVEAKLVEARELYLDQVMLNHGLRFIE